MPVGYVSSSVVLVPKLDIIANYFSQAGSVSSDSNLKLVCEQETSYKPINDYINMPNLYLYFTNTSVQGTPHVSVKRLIY